MEQFCPLQHIWKVFDSKASLFASVEPVTATFMTVVFMGAAFQFVDFIGLAGILGAVLMLSLLKKE